MNEGDRLKRILVLCLVVLMLVGCAKEEKTVKRAVFAWEGVEEADKQYNGPLVKTTLEEIIVNTF